MYSYLNRNIWSTHYVHSTMALSVLIFVVVRLMMQHLHACLQSSVVSRCLKILTDLQAATQNPPQHSDEEEKEKDEHITPPPPSPPPPPPPPTPRSGLGLEVQLQLNHSSIALSDKPSDVVAYGMCAEVKIEELFFLEPLYLTKMARSLTYLNPYHLCMTHSTGVLLDIHFLFTFNNTIYIHMYRITLVFPWNNIHEIKVNVMKVKEVTHCTRTL